MPIFKASKVIFVHIPKTGGTSIEKTLFAREDKANQFAIPSFYGLEPVTKRGYSYQHYTYCDLYEALGPQEFNKYRLILTVVRNPYHRLVSEFYFYHDNVLKQSVTYGSIKELQRLFTRFCRKFLSGKIHNDGHHRPQYRYLLNHVGRIDRRIHILHTEHLNKEFPRLLGYPLIEDRCNASVHKVPYADHYTKESQQLVLKHYGQDFIYFGYNPNNPAQAKPITLR